MPVGPSVSKQCPAYFDGSPTCTRHPKKTPEDFRGYGFMSSWALAAQPGVNRVCTVLLFPGLQTAVVAAFCFN